MTPILELNHVSKVYQLGAGKSSLRDVLLLAKSPTSASYGVTDKELLWAVNDISFDVDEGEVLGIIGRNGAGKTTILKLISRVTQPSSGIIRTNGRISALIELGAGFHPDLTGRENIYLNGVILGLSQKQIKKKFDSIVEFAELERFIDTPVKRYSSGMYARLGFSVAAHAEPDLLLVDEVLAVGDAAFQQKCYDFIHTYVSGGNTTVFVSHNLYVIEQLCSRVIWLENGNIIMMSTPSDILPRYFDHIEQDSLSREITIETERGNVQISKVSFMDKQGTVRNTFTSGDDITIRIEYYAERALHHPKFVVAVSGPQGGAQLFMASMLVDGASPASIQGHGSILCHFFSPPLTPKVYQVWGEVWGEDHARLLVNWQNWGVFRIVDNGSNCVGKGGIRHQRADALMHIPYKWVY